MRSALISEHITLSVLHRKQRGGGVVILTVVLPLIIRIPHILTIMNSILKDRYILFSLAALGILLFVCTVGSFSTYEVNGNGRTEITGVVTETSLSSNGTVFRVTDLSGNEFRCFYRHEMPEMPALCRLIGSFSEDGNMFFVDRIVTSDRW